MPIQCGMERIDELLRARLVTWDACSAPHVEVWEHLQAHGVLKLPQMDSDASEWR